MRRPARPRRRHGDRGAATAEVAGNLALMLLTVSAGVQVAAWGLAALGAHYTASAAAQEARMYGSTAAAGRAEGLTMLGSATGAALRDPNVTVTRDATTVTVTITGRAASVIPGVHPPVAVTVSVPVERIG